MEKELEEATDSKKKSSKSMKISISQENVENIMQKIEMLRGDNCSVSPSKLVDKIVALFFRKYYEKELDYLKESLFDKKKYVRSLLKKSTSQEELDRSIKILKQGRG